MKTWTRGRFPAAPRRMKLGERYHSVRSWVFTGLVVLMMLAWGWHSIERLLGWR